MRSFVGLLFLVSTVGSAQAQQAPCTVVGNVVKLVMPNPLQPLPPGGKYYPAGLLVPERRLPPQAFVAQDGFFHHVPILSVEPDEGPRRIVLVETSFSQDWRRMAGRIQGPPPELTAILAAARPGDSFALLAVGGPRLEVRFDRRPGDCRLQGLDRLQWFCGLRNARTARSARTAILDPVWASFCQVRSYSS